MDRLLLERLETGPRPSPEVAWTWRRLLASGGGIPIGRLAAEVGWSHKHLITRFRQQVGLRPKTAARLIRFDRVWRRLAQSEGPPEWADLAHEAGYADQAHLIREFRRFTGMTPTQFQAQTPPPDSNGGQEVNSIQDAVAAASYPGRSRSSVQARRSDAQTVGAVLGRSRGAGTDPAGGGDAGLRVSSSRPSNSM